MSKTTVVYPIVTALVKAEEIIGSGRPWRVANRMQERFLTEFFEPCRRESGSIAEIESIAAFTAEEINRFLREHGFQIKLKPFREDGPWKEFVVASVLDLLVSWLEPGTTTTLRGRDEREYAAAHLRKTMSSFYQVARHEHPIAQLKTKGNDLVYLTKLDSGLEGFELFDYARQLAGALKPIYDYDGVIFPMVDLKQEVDVSWLIDLHTINTEGREVKITQALQETHLAMNEQGARAKSAFAGGIAVAAAYIPPRPDLLIDEPFLIWFQRPGLAQPLFVGRITQEDWRNPGKL